LAADWPLLLLRCRLFEPVTPVPGSSLLLLKTVDEAALGVDATSEHEKEDALAWAGEWH